MLIAAKQRKTSRFSGISRRLFAPLSMTAHGFADVDRTLLPSTAFVFATAAWHYDPQDPRCPHDAWLERLTTEELAPNQEDVQHRYVAIHARLLGAYHDRYIELSKPKVLVGC
jgi:hypothetical protein